MKRVPIIRTRYFELESFDVASVLKVAKNREYETVTIERCLSSDEYWKSVNDKLQLIKDKNKQAIVIAYDYLPREVIEKLTWSPFNIVQFNINISDGYCDELLVSSLMSTEKFGVYSCVVVYPIIPTVLKTHELIDFVLRLPDCRAIGLNFIEMDSGFIQDADKTQIMQYSVPSKYIVIKDDKLFCSEEFISTFYDIIRNFLSPRKIDCFVYRGDL